MKVHKKVSAFSVLRKQVMPIKYQRPGKLQASSEAVGRKKRIKAKFHRVRTQRQPTPYRKDQRNASKSSSASSSSSPRPPLMINCDIVKMEASPKSSKHAVIVASTPTDSALKQAHYDDMIEVRSSSIGPVPHHIKKDLDKDTELETRGSQVEEVVVPRPPPYMFNSKEEGHNCFKWLIFPMEPDKFFRELWEKKPLLLKRHDHRHFRDLISTAFLDELLRENSVWFGKHVDITSYVNGKRETHNPPGQAYPSVVWDYYQNGCSVRFLNPQIFSTRIWKLNATLQEYFGSFVGANVYLTPPGSQGFAPHYDDIEAFVLQIEGRKNWKLYSPRTPDEVLPRYSSPNFTKEEIGEPILETTLEAGDLLYFPRGTIHQASTPDNVHSLHVTISTYQRNTWGDFFEKIIPVALSSAFENDVEFRQSLPRDWMQFMGVAHSDLDVPQRQQFMDKVKGLFAKLLDYLPVDAACDQMSKNFIHDSLPPALTQKEKDCSVYNGGSRLVDGVVVSASELDPDTEVKLLRSGILRLVLEDGDVRVYYSSQNSREYHQEEAQFIVISPALAPAVEHFLLAYPKYVSINQLPLETLEEKLEIATALYEKGLIRTKKPPSK